MDNSQNGLLKFITCGSVDDGKSTLIGHILYDAKLLYTDQVQALVADSRSGSRGGAIDYSLLLDGLMAEREQGITIDVAYRYFTTQARSFIVADTPGHEEYTRNMAVGASFADLAVILVDASRGVLTQTRRHARICALMGIRQFVFAVNKMDLIGFDENRFEGIQADIKQLCNSLGVDEFCCIPVSATDGDNVTSSSDNMSWYSGQPLLKYLETVNVSAERLVAESSIDGIDLGFYMPVQRVCRPDHNFRGFQGQVESGSVSVGDRVIALPSGETATVKAVFVTDSSVQTASAGQPVTIQLDREVDISRGCVIQRGAAIQSAQAFNATLLWMDESELVPGGDYWVKIGARLLPALVTQIQSKVDINTGELLTDAHVRSSVRKNEIALCSISLSEPAVIAPFRSHKTLGELILIDRVTHATAACGVIESIIESSLHQEGVTLNDGGKSLRIYLFDAYYYQTNSRQILRRAALPVGYSVGDVVPLSGDGYHYPSEFDIVEGGVAARIRGGRFVGFAEPTDAESGVDIVDVNGMPYTSDAANRFSAHHDVILES